MDLFTLIEPIVERPAKLYVKDKFIGEINTVYQLNHIRLLVRKGEIDSVYFLYDDSKGTTHQIYCYSDGRLSGWPEGFFNLIDLQLSGLLGWE